MTNSEAGNFQLGTEGSEVYGEPNVHPQPEGYCGRVNPIGPRSCEDEGKRCAVTLFFDYWRQHNLSIKVARIFNTYGPRMHPNDGRVVSNFIVQALHNKPITPYGDISLAKRTTKWKPQVPLEQGLQRTIAYFDQRLRGHPA
jgi:nucleoside-diphosphate-sugar epimerase